MSTFTRANSSRANNGISERGGIHDEKRLYFSLHYMELYRKTVRFIKKAGIPNQAGCSVYGIIWYAAHWNALTTRACFDDHRKTVRFVDKVGIPNEPGVVYMVYSAGRERKAGEAEHRGVDNDSQQSLRWALGAVLVVEREGLLGGRGSCIDVGRSGTIAAPVKYTRTIDRRRAWQRRRSQLHALQDTTAGVTGCHIKRKNGPKYILSAELSGAFDSHGCDFLQISGM